MNKYRKTPKEKTSTLNLQRSTIRGYQKASGMASRGMTQASIEMLIDAVVALHQRVFDLEEELERTRKKS